MQNDISLYDHLNSTAAYAICLYDYVKGENKDILSLTDNDDVFLLIGGDVSGIQNFIYDIISKGAAKNLKGRSFYLQLLVDTIIHDLLVELALPNNCVVYASGGGFYILAPNLGHTINKIKELRHKISKGLFEQHGTALAISMATQTIKINDLKQNNLPTVWRELSLSLGIGKSTKFFDLIAENPALFFNPAAFDNSLKRDAISGTTIQGTFVNLEETESKDDKSNQIFLDESNNVLLELGKKLKTADYLILSNNVIPEWKDLEIFRINPLKNNTTWYLLSEEKLLKFKDKIKKYIPTYYCVATQ
ncbi:MAG: hypothetical protein IPO63_17605 [Bacteroidetes bacterium]|nr:hypothetical protein [Bacteroidota bacterium]